MRTFTTLISGIFLAVCGGCGNTSAPVLGDPYSISSPAMGEVAGPRMSEGPGGMLTLSWMAPQADGTALRFAGFGNGQFSPAREVTLATRLFVNWADLPSVMQVDGDHWVAHWLPYSADHTYSYDVVVSQSFDGGDTWSDPVKAHDDATPTEHGFVSMYRHDDGVALLWLDGRNTAAEPGDDVLSTSMTLRSAVIAPDGTRKHEQLVDDSVCDCCQTDIAVSSRGPLAVYRDRTADEIRDIYITRFVDGAWEKGTLLYEDNWKIPGCPVNGPAIVANGDHVAIAWFSAGGDQPVVRVLASHDGGRSFESPSEVAAGRVAGFTGLALLPDESLAVSWVARNESGTNTLRLRHLPARGAAGPALDVAEIAQLRVLPQLGYQDGSLLLVWTDEVDGARHMRVAGIPVRL